MAKSHNMGAARRREHREALIAMHGNWCQHCLEPFTNDRPATLDHIHPKSLGGLNRRVNFQLLCGPCNRARAAWIRGLPSDTREIATSGS